MTPKTTQSQSSRNDDVEARVSLLEYQFGEVQKALGRIEGKQDAAIRQIDTLKYVGTPEFEAYRDLASKIFASKTELANIARLMYWLLGLLGSVFLLGVAAFIGIVIK